MIIKQRIYIIDTLQDKKFKTQKEIKLLSRRKTKNYKRFELQMKENEKKLSELRDNRQYLDLNQTELDIDLKPNEKFKKVEGLNYAWVSQYGRVIQLKKSGKYYLAKLTDDTKKSGKTYQRIWLGELNESAYEIGRAHV